MANPDGNNLLQLQNIPEENEVCLILYINRIKKSVGLLSA